MMKILNNQRIDNLRPEIQMAIRLAAYLYASLMEEFIITWTTGGRHSEHSLHPKRRAIDVLPPTRSRPEKLKILSDLKEILGQDYDVLDEGDHVHLEWDPK